MAPGVVFYIFTYDGAKTQLLKHFVFYSQNKTKTMFNIRIGLTKLLQKLKFLNYKLTGRYSSLGEDEPTDDN
jgi:hypothetical protein